MFDFNEIYKVYNVGGNYHPVPAIAFGVRVVSETTREGVQRSGYAYLIPNDLSMGRTIWGGPDDNASRFSIEILDEDRIGNDGEEVIWRFEPLTYAMWLALGSDIQGFSELRESLSTIYAVKEYYRQHWLDNGWWSA